jgi:uncharacterized membrane protein YtjA (UPF0391 family)
MLGWTIAFFVLALAAAALGFGLVAGAAAAIAQVLFVVFVIGIIVVGFMRAFSGRTP